MIDITSEPDWMRANGGSGIPSGFNHELQMTDTVNVNGTNHQVQVVVRVAHPEVLDPQIAAQYRVRVEEV